MKECGYCKRKLPSEEFKGMTRHKPSSGLEPREKIFGVCNRCRKKLEEKRSKECRIDQRHTPHALSKMFGFSLPVGYTHWNKGWHK